MRRIGLLAIVISILGVVPGRAENIFAPEPPPGTLCYDVLFAGLPAATLAIRWDGGDPPHLRVQIDTVGLVDFFTSWHFDAITRFQRRDGAVIPTEHRIDIRKSDKHAWSDLTYDSRGKLTGKYTYIDKAKKRRGRVEKDVRDGVDSGMLMLWLLDKVRAMQNGDNTPVRHVYLDGWDPIEVRLNPVGRSRQNHAGQTVPVVHLEMWTKSMGDTKPGTHRPEGESVQLYFEDSDDPIMLWATYPLPIFDVWIELDEMRGAGEECGGGE